MKYLFHGSQCGTILELEPRISLEFKKLVYATNDLKYALVRAGRQLDGIREEYYGLDKPFELAECYMNAFNDMFDCEGYVYLLNPDDFVRNPETGEYYSEKPVVPVGKMHIKNILGTMMTLNSVNEVYDFHWFYDEEYWSHVRGGLEGFLERKMANKQKMLELIAKGS